MAREGKSFYTYIEELHNEPMRIVGELPPRTADYQVFDPLAASVAKPAGSTSVPKITAPWQEAARKPAESFDVWGSYKNNR